MDAGKRGFDETRWSLVLRAGGAPTEASRKALADLCRVYRAPLLAFTRSLDADPDSAEEVLQAFLADLVESHALCKPNVIRDADPERGRFRTLLRTALRNYAINAHNARMAKKRGGGARFVDADDENFADDENPPSGALSQDRLYDRLWAQALLDRALARLGDEQARAGKAARFEALRERIALDEDEATLGDAAARLGMSGGALKLALFRLRKRFFDLVRAEVAETLERAEDVDAELCVLRAAWRADG